MSSLYVPPRYRVRLDAKFKPAQPVQVEIDLLPTGVFGVQDGRTPRRAEPARVRFDQKTGEMVVQDADGQPIVLDPVSLYNLPIGIGQTVSIAGSRISWIEPGTLTADQEALTKVLQRRIHILVAVLPLLGYQRRTPISVAKISVKQDGQVVGWAELLELNLGMRPYDRMGIEDELRTLEARLQTASLDTARWWSLVHGRKNDSGFR